MVRWVVGQEAEFSATVARMVNRGRPLTIYNDAVVISALTHHGVDPLFARDFTFSACHNVIAAWQEAGTGPDGFSGNAEHRSLHDDLRRR